MIFRKNELTRAEQTITCGRLDNLKLLTRTFEAWIF